MGDEIQAKKFAREFREHCKPNCTRSNPCLRNSRCPNSRPPISSSQTSVEDIGNREYNTIGVDTQLISPIETETIQNEITSPEENASEVNTNVDDIPLQTSPEVISEVNTNVADIPLQTSPEEISEVNTNVTGSPLQYFQEESVASDGGQSCHPTGSARCLACLFNIEHGRAQCELVGNVFAPRSVLTSFAPPFSLISAVDYLMKRS